MQAHHADTGIYIRSMATRGFLGGLARTTADVATALDASGKDVVLIETVGVGQDEIDIVRLAEVTVVILVPGMGDDVQSIKAGIMEIADIFVVNKADREGADQVSRDLRYMQSLGGRHSAAGAWRPPIVKTVASRGEGVQDVVAAVEKHCEWMRSHGELDLRRAARAAAEIEAIALGQVRRRFASVHGSTALDAAAQRVVAGKTDPYTAADELVAAL
jgi:LAO/AO transport system kinase